MDSRIREKIQLFWSNLTRQITPDLAKEFVNDTKVSSIDGKLRLYVPQNLYPLAGYDNSGIIVEQLKPITEEYLVELNNKPGLLALSPDPQNPCSSLKYLVPGGRFNEMYGWDSYFIVLGLLDSDRVDLASAMVYHLSFEVFNYGRILNANRTYYLGRSQPPFLTSMVLEVFERTHDKALLKYGIEASIKEYHSVWMAEPRMDSSGLSRYRPMCPLIPIETEPHHYAVLEPYAKERNLSLQEFIQRYNYRQIDVPEIKEFLLHDAAVRESGHDTSTRLHGVCADLATVDLNALLYKYETDIYHVVLSFPNLFPEQIPEEWAKRAANRRKLVSQLMWNEEDGMFYDYNTKTKEQHVYPSATTLYSLWAKIASPQQAESMVVKALPLFEVAGGLVAEYKTRGSQKRQWDYPAGWAPHQILAWEGLSSYGFEADAKRIAKKWFDMVMSEYEKSGKVYEKYNVVDHSGDVDAEYGNQGSSMTGFGWTNSSMLLYLRSFMSDEL